jgi:hypothetical protein
MTLMLHVIYGAVLGLTFDKLISRRATTQAHASA